ncbi:glutathione S-transferase T3-like isoform X2 [Capsella rubella]|nr:glutathione S-transferase T3-like isoform X2 [Capsella rubella]
MRKIQQPNQIEIYKDPSIDEDQPKERKERRKWSRKEDLMLISAWLNTSKDAIVVENEQKGSFWSRVAAYYAASSKLAGLEKRKRVTCRQRWWKINNMVCKFVVSFEAATKQKSSGQGDDDVMNLAYQIYLNEHKVKFTLEYAWRELRHDQKWCSYVSSIDNRALKRRKCDDLSAQSSSSFPDEDQARPPSVKAVKSNLLEFQGMWEIKQKDWAMKQRLSKNNLLETLLAKKEPLSDLEVALKNKLITDMLSNV